MKIFESETLAHTDFEELLRIDPAAARERLVALVLDPEAMDLYGEIHRLEDVEATTQPVQLKDWDALRRFILREGLLSPALEDETILSLVRNVDALMELQFDVLSIENPSSCWHADDGPEAAEMICGRIQDFGHEPPRLACAPTVVTGRACPTGGIRRGSVVVPHQSPRQAWWSGIDLETAAAVRVIFAATSIPSDASGVSFDYLVDAHSVSHHFAFKEQDSRRPRCERQSGTGQFGTVYIACSFGSGKSLATHVFWNRVEPELSAVAAYIQMIDSESVLNGADRVVCLNLSGEKRRRRSSRWWGLLSKSSSLCCWMASRLEKFGSARSSEDELVSLLGGRSSFTFLPCDERHTEPPLVIVDASLHAAIREYHGENVRDELQPSAIDFAPEFIDQGWPVDDDSERERDRYRSPIRLARESVSVSADS